MDDEVTYHIFDFISLGVYVIICTIITGCVIYYWTKNRRPRAFIILMMFITFFLQYYMYCLLTVDIAAGVYNCIQKTQGQAHPNCASLVPDTMIYSWRAFYWSIVILSLVNNYFKEFVECGEFSFFQKILVAFNNYVRTIPKINCLVLGILDKYCHHYFGSYCCNNLFIDIKCNIPYWTYF